MAGLPIEKGDFILVDYVGRVKETGEVFDTTLEDVAKSEGLYEEGRVYEPKLVVVGEGWLLRALEEHLTKMEVGQKETVEIPPEDAYGKRDPEKMKLVPLRRLTSRGITPRVGMRVNVDGKIATVRVVASGRVQLDFNHPLAGKTLVYEVTVTKKLEKPREKILALIHRRIPVVEAEKFKLRLGKKTLRVNMPEEAFYIEGIQVAKRGIASDVMKFFPEIDEVTFMETIKRERST